MSTDDHDIPVEACFTPRELVSELDRDIVGQNDAKKAVAIALRNRWRRRQVEPPLRDEITPKNIIMIGPTGVGKTEIARRLAKLARAPFVKVEASKFTEVGYVGRDVDSMVRDLVENAVSIVKGEQRQRVEGLAKDNVTDRLLDLLVPAAPATQGFEVDSEATQDASAQRTREKLRAMLEDGQLEDRKISAQTPDKSSIPTLEIFSSQGGMEEMGMQLQDLFGNMFPKKTRERDLTVKDARDLFLEEEINKLIDTETVIHQARVRAEETGIIFVDEIDKVAGRETGRGPDVSREGVQRDLLPIIEGATVSTKYGPVSTDHILFIAAGAFHIAKVSDLIPELQGRFPIRVELQSLEEEDLIRILQEPENALPRQYQAMLATEGLPVQFSDDALAAIAKIAADVNRSSENIGARRLHTVMEKLLEDLSFRAPELPKDAISITADYVREHLTDVIEDEDLGRYIL
jgi:ATP-dependent HslUV protease ATP-binding subunit HslU